MKQVFVTRLSDISATDKEGVGSIRQEGTSWYKYCKIANVTATVAGVAGTLVGYLATTGYGANTVVTDVADDADAIVVGAGALCGSCAGVLGVAYYGWIQIQGPCTLDTAVTSGAAGKSFFLSKTNKTGTVGANAYDQKLGVSLNATTGVLLTAPF
jgi:hypothetical protein